MALVALTRRSISNSIDDSIKLWLGEKKKWKPWSNLQPMLPHNR
jgi:hypothetical protein